jgi:hypothetical protein
MIDRVRFFGILMGIPIIYGMFWLLDYFGFVNMV